VQYSLSTWRYNEIPHFHSYFHQGQGSLPATTAQWAENAFALVNKDLDSNLEKPLPLIVCGSPQLFEQTNVILDVIPEGVGGFTEQFKKRIVIPFTGSYADFRHVLHHELVHAFQYAILFDNIGSSIVSAAATRLPLWFAEGSAEYLSSGWDSEADMFMMDQVIFGTVAPPGPELDGYMAYKGGQSFLHFLEASRGDSAFHVLMQRFCRIKNPENALKKTYGKDIKSLGEEWLQELKRIYWPEIGKRESPDEKAVGITTESGEKSFFNLKARLSPDGKHIAFFSDLKDYTRIFITDRTGKIETSISQAGYGGYFESFQPFRSGLCWGPHNDKIAFVSKNNGCNELRIVNILTHKLMRTFTPDLGSIASPDWSPDGKRIVFCGLNEDRSDLYIYEIETGALTRLTNDVRLETDPRFSQDDRSIIFAAQDTMGVRERSCHSQPSFDLFLYNLSDSTTKQLTSTPWNEKQPAWSPDGSQYAFVSDRNGINNIYITALSAPDSAKALTDFIGGCSDPDWARDTNMLVFTLFQKAKWNIWLIDKPTTKLHDSILTTTLWRQSLADSTTRFFKKRAIDADTSIHTDDIDDIRDERFFGPEMMKRPRPPATHPTVSEIGIIETNDSTKSTDSIAVATQSPDSLSKSERLIQATPDSTQAPIIKHLVSRPYRLQFSPDQVSMGLSAMPLYGYSGGGMIMLSDILGNQRIGLSGSLQGNLDAFDLFGIYLNSTYRLDFSAGGFYNRYFTYADYSVNSLYRDSNFGFMLGLSYPFSMFARLDLDIYYRHLDREPYTITSNRLTRDPSRGAYRLNITMPTLSYVFDNILWGITGPLNGVRAKANLLVSPRIQTADVSYISADCDLRSYLHLGKKFVWANKIAFGASSSLGGADSPRRFFLGGNENWFNYGINDSVYTKDMHSLYYSEFVVPFRGWNYFDLSGTRFAVINSEFRFPFVKNITIAWPLPMELRYINGALFIDAGNAWNIDQQIENIPLPRKIFGGFGLGMRANLGIFVLRWDLAWPTDWMQWTGKPMNYWSLGAEF
jgi:Tol biopolymer transport system component